MNEVYEKLVDSFVKNIREDVKKNAMDKYLEYLHESYDFYFQNAKELDFNAVASFCIKKEKVTHLDISEDAKMAFLFPDEIYIELEKIAFEIAHFADKKKKGEVINDHRSLDEYLELLDNLNSNISKRFRFSADRIYSDAIVDLKYIFEDESIESLRLQKLQ